MDLSFSPDVDAWICYLILVVVSCWVALRQVNRRLGNIDRIWFFPETWGLLLLYIAVPMVLFWFLDRTGAITDTSLVAALIVGLGYERIATGATNTVTAPGPVTDFWTPFLALADEISARAGARVAKAVNREADLISTKARLSASSFETLKSTVLQRSPNAAGLTQQLAAIDADPRGGNEADLRERKARLLFGDFVTVPDYRKILTTAKFVTWLELWLCSVHGWVKPVLAALFAIGAMVVIALSSVGEPLHYRSGGYDLWRLGKINATPSDQVRAQDRLIEAMNRKGSADGSMENGSSAEMSAMTPLRSVILDGLGRLLRDPSLATDRSGIVIQTMLSVRGAPGTAEQEKLACTLIQSLRARNPDIRGRIDRALRYLMTADSGGEGASSTDASAGKGPPDWQPSDSDSTTDIEAHIDSWRPVFQLEVATCP
jgi:hypothetical protein